MLAALLSLYEASTSGKQHPGGSKKASRTSVWRKDHPLVFPHGEVMKYLEKLQTAEGVQYLCTLCNRVSKRSDNMRNHMLSRHSEPTNEECPNCGRIYKNKPSLHVHLVSCSKNLLLDNYIVDDIKD